jgi:hypothetical protein
MPTLPFFRLTIRFAVIQALRGRADSCRRGLANLSTFFRNNVERFGQVEALTRTGFEPFLLIGVRTSSTVSTQMPMHHIATYEYTRAQVCIHHA